MARYAVSHLAELPPIDCPCGQTRRAFVDDPNQVASLHLLQVGDQTRTHYHKRATEIYYVLEGEGQMELDGKAVDVHPGDAILIKPHCRHRAVGQLKILVMPIPAFDPEDEWFP